MGRPKKNDQIDWCAVYADWLTGTMTNSLIARKYGVTPASVGQRIKRDGWSTTSGPVRQPVMTEPPEPTTRTAPAKQPKPSKSMTADQLRKRAKDLAQRLLAEVEDATTYEGEIGDILLMDEQDTVQRRTIRKALSSGERIKNLRELTAIIDAVDGKRKNAKVADAVADKPQGKKAEQQAEAESVAAGRFAPRSGPKLVANG